MFSAMSDMDTGYPRPGPAVGKNAAIEAFALHSAFKAQVTCAAFLAAVG